MSDQASGPRVQDLRGQHYEPIYEDTGSFDILGFFYRNRIKLLVSFVVIFGVCACLYFLWYLLGEKTVSGTVQLLFPGIEKQEYPSGRKFTVEDFRAPDLLSRALEAAGLAGRRIDPKELAAHLYVTPVIPAEVQARWKVQERAGTKREEYVPNEFRLEIALGGLSDAERMRLFGAVIKGYQERVKFDQASALGFVASWETSYEKLASSYDFWDLPALFGDRYGLLKGRIAAVIAESLQHQDPRFQLEFREIADALNAWHATRLLALEALTYQGRLVKNRDIMMQRAQYRIEELDIRIRQKTQEAADAMKLLEAVERPRALLAGQLSNKEGLPIVDASALDKLIKSDYVGPVVQRISRLQEEIQAMEADKARLQKQLSWLPKASNITMAQLPPGHRELVDTLSAEFKSITERYNRMLDEYLTATITSKVVLGRSPVLARGGPSPLLVLAGLAALSFFLGLAYVGLESRIRQLKQEERK